MKTNPLLLLALLASLAGALRAESPLEQAVAALKKNDLATADALLTPLAAAPNPDAAVLHQLGIVRLRQNRPAEAVELAEKVVQVSPDVADHHAQLGMAIAQRMRDLPFMQQAMMSMRMKQVFEEATRLDPRHVGALIGLTRWYSNAPEMAGGSLVKAREFATRVRELVPWLGEFELAQIAERAEQPADALAHYEKVVELNPKHAGAHASAGRLLAAAGRSADARARFESALQLDPNLQPARDGLAALGP